MPCRCCRWTTPSADEEVADFVARIRRFLELAKTSARHHRRAEDRRAVVSLRYESGELVRAATRGDGAEGEDVTANVRTIKDIPHKLKGGRFPTICEVRGEVYMTKQDFLALNKRQAEAGEQVFANPRNRRRARCARRMPRITASRPLASSPMPGAR